MYLYNRRFILTYNFFTNIKIYSIYNINFNYKFKLKDKNLFFERNFFKYIKFLLFNFFFHLNKTFYFFTKNNQINKYINFKFIKKENYLNLFLFYKYYNNILIYCFSN